MCHSYDYSHSNGEGGKPRGTQAPFIMGVSIPMVTKNVLHMPYFMGVSTPIVTKSKYYALLCQGCEHTRSHRTNDMRHTFWVYVYPCLFGFFFFRKTGSPGFMLEPCLLFDPCECCMDLCNGLCSTRQPASHSSWVAKSSTLEITCKFFN